ncbi:MAG TPA: HAMP domain-containing sensor histidine kinase, partial [Acidimicrobiia bacterium]|nr:HAMP domain-containing sensor histidine kinase [Acidimicrobiia bacterium]
MATASVEPPARSRAPRLRGRILPVLLSTLVVITVAAGAGSWLLAGQATRADAVSQVIASAKSFGRLQSGVVTVGGPGVTGPELGVEVHILLRLVPLASKTLSAKFLPVNDPAALSNPDVPAAVLRSAASSPTLGAGSVVGGSTGSLAWAVEAVEFRVVGSTRGGTPIDRSRRYVLVLTRTIGSPSVTTPLLLLAGAMVAFAVVVSLLFTRRLTRPLRRAVATTERIAAGDLDARVGAPRGDFPELSALGSAIDTMAESLGSLRNAERQFLLSVSHELRTPLTSIRGYSEAILDGTAVDPTQAAGIISVESRRLERLVGDLLDLAKLDAKTFSFNFRTVDATEVVEEVAEELRPVADSAGLALVVRPLERPLLVRVDPDRLDQVLANLVENAAKFARSAITLGTATDGRAAQLIVDDDGPGIPPSELGRIFERHYSIDRHARPGRPSGSGL